MSTGDLDDGGRVEDGRAALADVEDGAVLDAFRRIVAVIRMPLTSPSDERLLSR